MPFPGDLTTITVTGTFRDVGNNPLTGSVVFDAGQVLVDATGLVVFNNPATRYIQNGIMQPIVLPCTDNSTINPTNFQYKVTVSTTGGTVRSYYIQLPHTLGASVDLSALTAVQPVTTMGAYMPLSGGSFTGGVDPAVFPLTDAATITVNAPAANVFTVTLGGNRSLAAPTGGVDGQTIRLRITQDGTGSRTLSYASGYEFVSALPAPVLSTTAAATDVLLFEYNAAKSKWVLLAYLLGE